MLDDWGTRCHRWSGVRSERIDVRGTTVHTLRAGDESDGTPQLLVHGLGGSSTNWLEVLPALASRGPVIAPDLPGFGRTQPPRVSGTGVKSNAGFLKALLSEVGWERVRVHGNSMGGLLAVLLADLVPERIDRLVLVSPALTVSPRQAARIERATLLRFGPFLHPRLGALVLGRTYGRMTPEEVHRDSIEFVVADPTRLSDDLLAVGLENVELGRSQPWRTSAFSAAASSLVRTLVGRRRLEAAIARITSPTLVMWGDRDRLIGRPVIDRIRAIRPDWTVEVLDGVGHAPMMETPEMYLHTVDAWTASTPSASCPS